MFDNMDKYRAKYKLEEARLPEKSLNNKAAQKIVELVYNEAKLKKK